jgi:Homeodomain-like domain
MNELRLTTLLLIDEAVAAGCRLSLACREIELDPRTVQRWRKQGKGGEDRRKGPHSAPQQKLTDAERKAVVETANAPEFRDLSPKQIVARLADRGQYIASESTFYRVLRAEGLMAHRSPSKPRTVRRPRSSSRRAPTSSSAGTATWTAARTVQCPSRSRRASRAAGKRRQTPSAPPRPGARSPRSCHVRETTAHTFQAVCQLSESERTFASSASTMPSTSERVTSAMALSPMSGCTWVS